MHSLCLCMFPVYKLCTEQIIESQTNLRSEAVYRKALLFNLYTGRRYEFVVESQ